MSSKDILVVGYPKSGNTWLARLLGDVLDSPVMGIGSAHPLAEEGKDRKGDYIVRQLHLRPVDNPLEPNYDAWTYSLPAARMEHIIIIMRNPLDVIVSAYHYWNIESMDKAIDAVLYGNHPLSKVGDLPSFYGDWSMALGKYPPEERSFVPYLIWYEDLLQDTVFEIDLLLNCSDISYDSERILESVERQSFQNRRKELEDSGDKYNYGSTIQAHNLRSGRAGSWKDELTTEQVAYIRDRLPESMVALYGI